MKWPTVALGDVAQFIRGVTFKPGDVLDVPTATSVGVMRTKNVQTHLDLNDVLQIPRELVRRDEQYLRRDDILISSANSWNLVGRCSWVPELEQPAAIGGFVTGLRVASDKVDSRYLYHWFSSPNVQALVRNTANQTTNIANLNLQQCQALSLPLPPLDEQRRIAAILDHADALRVKRREVISHLNDLAQSIFTDMFGDPARNPHKLPLVPLGEVGTLDRGVSKHRPRNDPALLGGEYPLIQTGDVANSGGYITSFKSSYSELGLSQSKLWPKGTLCITIAANIAQTGILTFPACFPDSIVGFKADTPTTVFVRTWLTFLQATLEASAPQSAQRNINLAILRQLLVPLPSSAERERFAGALQHSNSLRTTADQTSAAADRLFASLQSRAFRGEL